MRLPAITRWMFGLSGKIDRFCIFELLKQSHPSRGENKSMDPRFGLIFLGIIPVCINPEMLDLCEQIRKSVRHQEKMV